MARQSTYTSIISEQSILSPQAGGRSGPDRNNAFKNVRIIEVRKYDDCYIQPADRSRKPIMHVSFIHQTKLLAIFAQG
jgi:hypothetical protein